MPHYVSCRYSYADYGHIACMLCGENVPLFTPGTVTGKDKNGEEEEYCFAKAVDGSDDILMIPCKHGMALYCPTCLARARQNKEDRYHIQERVQIHKPNLVEGVVDIVLSPIFV